MTTNFEGSSRNDNEKCGCQASENNEIRNIMGVMIQNEHIIQLWDYVLRLAEPDIMELIAELSPQYDDPEQAEISFIALWNYFDKSAIL